MDTDKQKFLNFLDNNDFESWYAKNPVTNDLDLRIRKEVSINGGLYIFNAILNHYALEFSSYKQNIKWLKREFFKIVFDMYWGRFEEDK